MYNKLFTDDFRDYLITGISGCGKTYFVENHVIPEIIGGQDKCECVERYVVTESSSYEDLFGAYMPVMKDGKVTYEFVPGPAARIIAKAFNDENNEYVLFIENINSGNAYEVFGNLFQLLDRKSGISEYEISMAEEVQAYFDSELGDKSPNKLYLPNNLFLICTMTDTTSGVYRLDTAFRRRFKMVYMSWDGTVFGNIPNSSETNKIKFDEEASTDIITWNDFRNEVNKKIKERGDDKQFTEHFLKFNSDNKIGNIDFIITVYSHLLENVYRDNKENDILHLKSLSAVIEKLKVSRDWEDFFNKSYASILQKLNETQVVNNE